MAPDAKTAFAGALTAHKAEARGGEEEEHAKESQGMQSSTSNVHDDSFAEEPLLSIEDHVEIQQMRMWLKERGWTEADAILSDNYIHKVLDASKDGKIPKFEYASSKLQKLLEWRRKYKVERNELGLNPPPIKQTGDNNNKTTFKAFAESSSRSACAVSTRSACAAVSTKSLRKLNPNMSLTVHERLTLVRIARRFLHPKARSAILGSLVKGNLRLSTLKYLTRILARIPHSEVNAMREACVCVCVLCCKCVCARACVRFSSYCEN